VGNFTLVSSPATGNGPHSLVAGDFNGDGRLDLAVANYDECPATVSILLGDGNGNFSPASSPNAGGCSSTSVAVGDFNRDGKLDLAVANDFGKVSILFGNGLGNFNQASSVATSYRPMYVAVADFNDDGKLDLAVANYNDTKASILLGDGLGNFTLASSPGTGYNPFSETVGDFNADGKLDLAVLDDGGMVSILLGDGHGNFTSASSPRTGFYPHSVAVGDFNGDGKLDLSVANSSSGTLTILLQVLPGPAVTLSATTLTFPLQPINTSSSPLRVFLSNGGSGTLTIASIGVAGPFSLSKAYSCSTITPGGFCTIDVVLQPKKEGTATGAVTISDNAPGTPHVISLTGLGVGKPALSASIVSKSKSATTVTATLQLTNHSTGTARQILINQIALQTLGGTGTVSLSGPALPLSVGSLAIGDSTSVTLTLNVPATVTKFSLSEKGTLQDIAGNTLSFSLAQVIYP
jgi:hypothetical protein